MASLSPLVRRVAVAAHAAGVDEAAMVARRAVEEVFIVVGCRDDVDVDVEREIEWNGLWLVVSTVYMYYESSSLPSEPLLPSSEEVTTNFL